MATAQNVKDKINSLISQGNAVTGKSDKDLSAVISTLASGYGQGGGITPSGIKEIVTNGLYDVSSFEKANVAVPATGITPTGTINIVDNGTFDVSTFASAQVNVPKGITPSGSLTISQNGTFDVTNFASAVVNVPAEEQISVAIPITLSSALGGGTNTTHTLLSANAFVKKHYAKDGFTVVWLPISNATTAVASGVIGAMLQANRFIFTTKASYTGFGLRSAGATSSPQILLHTAKVNGNGYNVSFRADSPGNLKLYVASSYTVPAGNYMLIMTVAE